MIIQDRDGTLLETELLRSQNQQQAVEYYASVPAHLLDQETSLIDRLINLAFDTLRARRLTVRVYETE